MHLKIVIAKLMGYVVRTHVNDDDTRLCVALIFVEYVERCRDDGFGRTSRRYVNIGAC